MRTFAYGTAFVYMRECTHARTGNEIPAFLCPKAFADAHCTFCFVPCPLVMAEPATGPAPWPVTPGPATPQTTPATVTIGPALALEDLQIANPWTPSTPLTPPTPPGDPGDLDSTEESSAAADSDSECQFCLRSRRLNRWRTAPWIHRRRVQLRLRRIAREQEQNAADQAENMRDEEDEDGWPQWGSHVDFERDMFDLIDHGSNGDSDAISWSPALVRTPPPPTEDPPHGTPPAGLPPPLYRNDGAGAAVEKSIDWHLSPLSPVHCLHRRPGP